MDSFGLDIVGRSGTVYNFYRQPGVFAYQEYDGGTARVLTDLSLVPVAAVTVPEPATWATMVMGLGLAGGALRRRRSALNVVTARV